MAVAVMSLVVTASGESDEAEIYVDISDACEASIQDLNTPGIGEGDHTQIGLGDIGFFDGIVSNTGNQYIPEVQHELRVWGNFTVPDDLEDTENETEENETDIQSHREDFIHADNVSEEEFQLIDLNQQEPTINDTEENETEENETEIDQDLDWNIVEEEWEHDEDPENYTYYNWTDELHTVTNFEPLDEENETSINQFYREFNANYPPGDYIAELVIDYSCENNGNGTDSRNSTFEIVDLEGEGVIPDDHGMDEDVDQEVETDAEEPDEADTEFDQDANETDEEAETREGELEDFPGVTEVPEPDPDPLPWLGLEQHPHNISYTAEREGFTEMGIEVENTGDANLEDIELEPRVADEDWNFEIGEVDSLNVDERENTSVFIEPTENVDPGLYDIPVYATLPERDLDLEYLSVEVLPDLAPGQIDVLEAPTSLEFVMETENDIPVVVQNPGEEDLTGVEAELRGHEQCGESDIAEFGDLEPEEQASGVIEFEAGDSLEECEARLVVSSDDDNYAFAEVDIRIVEEEIIVPEEFRVPLVASLWTVLLLAYSITYRKFDLLNQPAMKMPLLLLVVGEVFIVVYLASVYYGVFPQEFMPF